MTSLLPTFPWPSRPWRWPLSGRSGPKTRRPRSTCRLSAELLETRTVPSTISGALFQDANASGSWDAGEPSLALAGVQIYLDENHSGALDNGDVITTTNEFGQYTFMGLDPGIYTVAQVARAGSLQTAPATTPVAGVFGEVREDFASPESGYVGLAWADGSLYVVQPGPGGTGDATNDMYQVDPATGNVVGGRISISGQIRVITFDGTYFGGADNSTRQFVPFDANGQVVPGRSIAFPSDFPSQFFTCWGLVWARDHLWVASNYTDRIYALNPNGTVASSFAAPDTNLLGLAFDGCHLWASETDNDQVYEINPETGAVVRSLTAPNDFPFGVAYDGQFLWVGDHMVSRILKYDLGTTASWTVDVRSGDATGENFGDFQLGTISGQVFQDNGNGVKDPFEPGLEIVQLRGPYFARV
jgi:SdrD B-like domain